MASPVHLQILFLFFLCLLTNFYVPVGKHLLHRPTKMQWQERACPMNPPGEHPSPSHIHALTVYPFSPATSFHLIHTLTHTLDLICSHPQPHHASTAPHHTCFNTCNTTI